MNLSDRFTIHVKMNLPIGVPTLCKIAEDIATIVGHRKYGNTKLSIEEHTIIIPNASPIDVTNIECLKSVFPEIASVESLAEAV
jgi:hypothetical protein